MLDPGRAWGRADRGLGLPDRVGDDKCEKEGDQPEQCEVVKEYAKAAWHVVAAQPVHTGAHRSRDHESEEEQADDDLDLPERERGDHDRDGDERRNRCFSGGIFHYRRFLVTR